MKRYILVLVIFFFTLLQMRFFWGSEFPITHDGENHLLRIANYRIALREGQFPPRFAPNLLNGYGYPVFNYNYPLANILSLPLSVLKIHPELSLKIIFTFFVILGLLGIYALTQSFRLSFKSSLVAISTFALSPYFFSTVLFRGNIGEIMGIALLPWMLWGIKHIRNTKKISLRVITIFICFALAHNLTVVFSAPFLLLFALSMMRKNKQDWKRLFVHITVAVLGVSWFWLPAVFEQSQVVVSNATLVSDFSRHALQPIQLLTSPIEFGFSYPGFIDSLTFQTGVHLLFALVLSLYFIVTQLIKRNIKQFVSKNNIFLLFFLTAVLSLIGTLSLAKVFWDVFPFLKILQFPWRLLSFATLTLSFCVGFLWQYLSVRVQRIFVVLILFQILLISRVQPLGFFHHDKQYYDRSGQSSSTQNENLPKTFVYSDVSHWEPKPSILKGEGVINVQDWSGSSRQYTVSATSDVTVVEPTMFFLGWKTLISSDETVISAEYIFDEETKGRIAYQLSSGVYQINTRFTQQTYSRIIGNTAFVIFLVTTAFLVMRKNIQW